MADEAPVPKSKRAHPRLAIRISVELEVAGRKLVLATRNLSVGGAAVGVAPAEAALLRVGQRFPARLLDATNAVCDPVSTVALVMRHDPDAVALRWILSDMKTAAAINRLIADLALRQ